MLCLENCDKRLESHFCIPQYFTK